MWNEERRILFSLLSLSVKHGQRVPSQPLWCLDRSTAQKTGPFRWKGVSGVSAVSGLPQHGWFCYFHCFLTDHFKFQAGVNCYRPNERREVKVWLPSVILAVSVTWLRRKRRQCCAPLLSHCPARNNEERQRVWGADILTKYTPDEDSAGKGDLKIILWWLKDWRKMAIAVRVFFHNSAGKTFLKKRQETLQKVDRQ